MKEKWHNCERDLPEHRARVVISYQGVYYPATYDASGNRFETLTEDEKLVVPATEESLYWSNNN